MIPRNFAFGLSLLIVLSACVPAESNEVPTSTVIATLVPSATTDWFPATATFTTMPTQLPSPTADMHPDLGELIVEDNFSSPSPWPDTQSNRTRVTVENNRLNLYTDVPGALLLAPRNAPAVNDFYVELTANSSLCEDNDEYGMMLRINSAGDHYRFALSCDGRAKVERVLNGAISVPAEWQAFPHLPSVSPSIVKLSVWASGSEMRFFVDDVLLFTVNDTVIYSGRVGAFIRARGEGPLTVSFSDLFVYSLTN